MASSKSKKGAGSGAKSAGRVDLHIRYDPAVPGYRGLEALRKQAPARLQNQLLLSCLALGVEFFLAQQEDSGAEGPAVNLAPLQMEDVHLAHALLLRAQSRAASRAQSPAGSSPSGGAPTASINPVARQDRSSHPVITREHFREVADKPRPSGELPSVVMTTRPSGVARTAAMAGATPSSDSAPPVIAAGPRRVPSAGLLAQVNDFSADD